MKITSKIIGLDGLEKQFFSLSKDITESVSSEVAAAAQDWAAQAQRDAPKDTSQLTGEIRADELSDFEWEIVANKEYAPFMEFGTKGKYQSIPGTEAIAAQFKGKSTGNFGAFFKAIVQWVRRKGIAGRFSVKTHRRVGSKINQLAEDYSAAWPIAMSILRNGVNPHPFFFKQMEVVWPKMVSNIQRAIENKSRVRVIMPGDIFRPQIITI